MILAGDHLYRMNYAEMAEFHWQSDADMTVAVHPVPREEATRLGILKCETDGRISDFVEKPQDRETQDRFVSRPDDLTVPSLDPWVSIYSRQMS